LERDSVYECENISEPESISERENISERESISESESISELVLMPVLQDGINVQASIARLQPCTA
jgi:hypothetical protein